MSVLYHWHILCLTKLQRFLMLLCSNMESEEIQRCNPAEDAVNSSQVLPQIWVSKQMLAARYGVCVRTIHNLMRKRILPSYPLGRAVRFHPAECDATLAKLRRASVLEEGGKR